MMRSSDAFDTPRIILSETPRYVDLSRWDAPLCIHDTDHGGIIGCDATHLSDFAEAPRDVLDGYDTAVFLGLMNLITPSNRTDDVWEVVFNQLDVPCVSVDRYLFRSDPWRAWFHFGLVGAEYRDYTYSYLAETDYEQYFNGKTDDNPFSLDEIRTWGDGVIESEYDHYFREFHVSVDYEAGPIEQQEYSERLDELFAEKNTIGQVRRGLESYADDIYSGREIPNRHQLFRGEKCWDVSITNLPIDRWKASYLQDLVALTDGIGQAFHEPQEASINA